MRRDVSIRTLLIFGFGGLLALSLALVTWVAFRALTGHTFALVETEAGSRLDAVISRIEALRSQVETQAGAIAAAFSRGDVGFDDPEGLAHYLRGVATAADTPRGLVVRDNEGRGLLARLPSADIVARDWSNEFGPPGVAPAASLGSRRGWTQPIWIDEIVEPALSHLHPLEHGKKTVGVLIQALTMRQLSRELAELPDVDTRIPFILYGDDAVIAHPNLARRQHVGSSERPLPSLAELGDPVLMGFAKRQDVPSRAFTPTRGFRAGRIVLDEDRYIAVYRTTSTLADRPVTVGVYFNVRLARPTFLPLIAVVAVGVGVLLISGLLAYAVSRATARSMRALARASTQVAAGELDHVEVPLTSRLREIATAATAFDAMVSGLRERERIRALVGRVMPEEVAARMLATDGAFDPVESEATVLFCDLAGFSTLCEGIEPAAVVGILNEYFTAAVEIIQEQGGIITQFQGDGILAVFNVPETLADHPERAVVAAARILHRAKTTDFGGYRLAVRIGINTGALVAGNVGAERRMNYTVHGDCVNVAARLEQLNKELGTTVLISEATATRVRLQSLEPVGRIPVRGREAPVAVYTLSGEDHRAPAPGGA